MWRIYCLSHTKTYKRSNLLWLHVFNLCRKCGKRNKLWDSDVLQDLKKSIREIAKFLDRDLSDEEVNKVVSFIVNIYMAHVHICESKTDWVSTFIEVKDLRYI